MKATLGLTLACLTIKKYVKMTAGKDCLMTSFFNFSLTLNKMKRQTRIFSSLSSVWSSFFIPKDSAISKTGIFSSIIKLRDWRKL